MALSVETARRSILQSDCTDGSIIEVASEELIQAYAQEDKKREEYKKQEKTIRVSFGVNHLSNHIQSRDEHKITVWEAGRMANIGNRRW
jgi:hypothetical protein